MTEDPLTRPIYNIVVGRPNGLEELFGLVECRIQQDLAFSTHLLNRHAGHEGLALIPLTRGTGTSRVPFLSFTRRVDSLLAGVRDSGVAGCLRTP